MKSHAILIGLLLVLLAALGCDEAKRREGKNSRPGKSAANKTAEQGGAEAGGAALELEIVEIHVNRKPLDVAPWHAAGGDWTFLDCLADKTERLPVTIGLRSPPPENPQSRVARGEALLAVADVEAGTRLVELAARALGQKVPPGRSGRPAGRMQMEMVVFGRNLSRLSHDEFKEHPTGDWTTTSWYLGDEGYRDCAAFHYNLEERRAELFQRHSDERENLALGLSIFLRDGPLPERTPATDPNLTLAGPRIEQWRPLAEPAAICRFSPRGRRIAVAHTSAGQTAIWTVSVTQPQERKVVASMEGSLEQIQWLPAEREEAEQLLAVQLPRGPADSDDDDAPPVSRNLWLLDPQEQDRQMLSGMWDRGEWTLEAAPVSPDGQFAALRARSGQRSRATGTEGLYLVNLRSHYSRKVDADPSGLRVVGWENEKGDPRAMALAAAPEEEDGQAAYRIDPSTGRATRLDEVPIRFALGRLLSPDGRHTAEVRGDERLVLLDVATGQARAMKFHPYDRHWAADENLQWTGPRYLLFSAKRPELINVQTFKMNFPVAKDKKFLDLQFNADLTWAIAADKEGRHYVGRVVASAEATP